MKNFDYFFNSYESIRPSPLCLQWHQEPKSIFISPEEFLYMDKLITLEAITGISHEKTYILTNEQLIETLSTSINNKVISISTLYLNNPTLKKVKRPDLGL